LAVPYREPGDDRFADRDPTDENDHGEQQKLNDP